MGHNARVTQPSRRNNGERLETRDVRLERVRSAPSSKERARTAAPRYGKERQAVMIAVADALRAGNVPPLDERLKSIVVTQVRNLLAGGYDLETIRHVAVELALSYDGTKGHSRLPYLQQRVQQLDAETAYADHERRKQTERETPLDPRVAAILRSSAPPPTGRPHPSSHAFRPTERANTCALCDGPLGVHVRLVALDDDGHAAVIPTGVAKKEEGLPF